MSTPARIILLIAAALCTASVALLGGGSSRAVEPEYYTSATSGFWLVVGSVFSAPLWVPALIPSRYSTTLKVVRWIGAITLLLPIYMFGSIALHNLRRSLRGVDITPATHVEGVVLTCVCLCCLVILLWPESRSPAKRAL